MGVLLSLPVVQTKIAQYITTQINKDYNVDINIDQVAISIFGGIKLKKVLINDHHKDTLFYINRLQTDMLDVRKSIQGKLIFTDLRVNGLFFNMKNYKNELQTNLDVFIAAFDDGQPSSGNFLLTADKIHLTDSRFLLSDENKAISKEVDFLELNALLEDFKIKGSDVTIQISEMSFKDFRGLRVNDMQSSFTYTKNNIVLENLLANTSNSTLDADVVLRYIKEDFKDFNNKVVFDININQAALATDDIKYFYDELGRGNIINISAQVSGTLNDLWARNLHLIDDYNSEIIGDVNFKNLFGNTDQFFLMNGSFNKVSSNYHNLNALLPNILGSKLPSALSNIGQFTLDGHAIVTQTRIITDFNMHTALGTVTSNLEMSSIDHIDAAVYKGNIKLNQFDIGAFLGRKEIGKVSLDVYVDGSGFTEELIDAHIQGKITQMYFNQYNYVNLKLDGNFKKPYYKGKVYVNDPNLFLDFDGIVDISQNENVYKFDVKVDYADLHALNFMKNDSISIIKGNFISNLSGSSINNIKGEVQINQASYQNIRDIYTFNDFQLTSYFDNNQVRTITINSPDIIEGNIKGNFDFEEVVAILENSLGSLYTNYEPNKIKKNQYFKFDFSIYNKIIEVFLPNVAVGSNTVLSGAINADDNDFKLNFSSPEIIAYDIAFEKFNVIVDNKNPFFNTYVELDSIKSKFYKISDFSLINVTAKDTLFFRSEFKGGDLAQDYYNLNLYHTIDIDKNSVIGLQKSELNFQDYLWFLNEKGNNRNRVVVDKSLKNFIFDDIELTHENQAIFLSGVIDDAHKVKDISLLFNEVNIGKIIPESENLELAGALNGTIQFLQEQDLFKPNASLIVTDLVVNTINLGNLNLDIKGNESLTSFDVNTTLRNQRLESFNLDGNFEIIDKVTHMDLDLRLNQFNIGAFSNVGGEIISNIRGLVSGTASFGGTFSSPEMNGRLFLNNTGLTIPYLNVDYEMSENSIIDITERQFLFRNIPLTDSKFKTKGNLNGNIRHNNLADWKFDLGITTDHLVVLDTDDDEDTPYYGRAFISGDANLTGPLNGLLINVRAKSQKGTSIKIPISNAESIGEANYIKFITRDQKYDLEVNDVVQKNYKGLQMDFDLDITEDAEIEVIIDKESGHAMRGKGRGLLLLRINTLGTFNMFGDYQVYEGIYNFRYRGLISKRLEVEKFGSIIWEGDPMRARLNLRAKYETTANPAVLLDNPSFNRKVPVTVAIDLTGNLSNPEPEFEILFPTVSSVLRSEIQTKLDDRDTRQTQAIYLLASGGFLAADGSAGQNALANNLFETFTGVFNDLFSDEDGKINVGVDVVSADRTPGRETDGSVGVTTSFNINERISINGKLGVPVGGVNDAAVVGDVEILYRVDEEGNVNMRFFNRENDINYIGEGIGYTQGLGISYQVDFDYFRELINKIFKAKRREENEATMLIPDSDFSPEFIHFTEGNKNKEKKATPTEDQVPEIE